MKTRFLLLFFVALIISPGIAMACDMMEGHDDKSGTNGTGHESCNIDEMMGKEMGIGMSYGMMSGGMWSSNHYALFNLFGVLYLLLIIGLTILVYLWIVKLWRELNKR